MMTFAAPASARARLKLLPTAPAPPVTRIILTLTDFADLASDELTGGYLYMHYAPDSIAFDHECRRLLKDIHY